MNVHGIVLCLCAAVGLLCRWYWIWPGGYCMNFWFFWVSLQQTTRLPAPLMRGEPTGPQSISFPSPVAAPSPHSPFPHALLLQPCDYVHHDSPAMSPERTRPFHIPGSKGRVMQHRLLHAKARLTCLQRLPRERRRQEGEGCSCRMQGCKSSLAEDHKPDQGITSCLHKHQKMFLTAEEEGVPPQA